MTACAVLASELIVLTHDELCLCRAAGARRRERWERTGERVRGPRDGGLQRDINGVMGEIALCRYLSTEYVDDIDQPDDYRDRGYDTIYRGCTVDGKITNEYLNEPTLFYTEEWEVKSDVSVLMVRYNDRAVEVKRWIDKDTFLRTATKDRVFPWGCPMGLPSANMRLMGELDLWLDKRSAPSRLSAAPWCL
jgi:hypothetical protein